jgi:hypothetical protein
MLIRMTTKSNMNRLGAGAAGSSAAAGASGTGSAGSGAARLRWPAGAGFTHAARWAAAIAVVTVLAIFASMHDSSPAARSAHVVTVAAAGHEGGLRGDVRVARTPTEQLSITRYLAAEGYEIHGVGLDRRVAIDPVIAAYPHARLTAR